jgi:hypothetical protein
VAACALLLAAPSTDAADTTAARIDGSPMTVYVGPRGQCQSSYLVNGGVAGNFYPGGAPYAFSPVGDCGLFLAFPSLPAQPAALAGHTFGFQPNAPAPAFSLFTPVGQSGVTGSGSSVDPYTQTTTFDVVDSNGARDVAVTETTSYVNGDSYFTSSYDVENVTSKPLYFRALYAADLFVNERDLGTGLSSTVPTRFIGGQSNSSGVLGGLQEALAPAPPWSSSQELSYPAIWETLASSDQAEIAFTGGVEATEVNDAVAVEWDQLRSSGLAAGARRTFTVLARTQVPSALGVQQVAHAYTVGQTATVSVTATDTAGTPYAGRRVVYSVGEANPKLGSVSTDAGGVATISYVGTVAGVDTMHFYLDLPGKGVQTRQDPASSAQITWSQAPPAPDSGYSISSIRSSPTGTITLVLIPRQDGTATATATVPTASISRVATVTRKGCPRGKVRIKRECRPATTVSGRATAGGRARLPLRLTLRSSSGLRKALARHRVIQLAVKVSYRSSLGGSSTVRLLHLGLAGANKRRHR